MFQKFAADRQTYKGNTVYLRSEEPGDLNMNNAAL